MCCWLFSMARPPPPPAFLVQPSGPIPVIVQSSEGLKTNNPVTSVTQPRPRVLSPGGRVREVPGHEVLTSGVTRCSRGTTWMARLVFKGAIHSTKITGNFGPKLNGSVRFRPEKFRKNWSNFWGGPVFSVGPVGNFGWIDRARMNIICKLFSVVGKRTIKAKWMTAGWSNLKWF